MKRAGLAAAFGFLLGVASLSFPTGPEVHVPLGGARGPLMMSGLGPSEAVWSLPDQEAADARRDFYFRQIETAESAVSVPLRPRGRFALGVRMDTTVRTRVDVAREGAPIGTVFVSTGRWNETLIAENLERAPLDFALRFEAAPLVRRADPENFRRYVDELVLRSGEGFDLPWSSRVAGGFLLAFFVLLCAETLSGAWAGLPALLGSGALWFGTMREPVALALGLPRLLGFVGASVLLTALLGLALKLGRRATLSVALMGAGLVFGCGLLSFLPGHSPADLDIHIWRTVDLKDVAPTYEAWFRYGSHYPTPSQIRGSATEALGGGPAIPYSPLPYVLFYAAHATGLDLHWSMNALEALSLSLLLPLVFALAKAASSNTGGFLATALMAMDLATIHHLGRAHSPAVVGGALGLAALLALGLTLPRMAEPGGWKIPALLLGMGALGYSSTPLFYALFGVALLLFASFHPETRGLLRPLALALAAGGLLALVLFYGHYLPGLMSGRGSALGGDPFPGRTFFIFHNESRQSLRLWRLGLFIPLLAAVPATLFAIRRVSAPLRAFLLAWIAAWAGIMLLKEPWGLPILLRWAKEDFYLAPAVALVIGIAVARVESRALRMTLTAAAVLTSLLLRLRDFGYHIDTLRFLR